EINQKTHQELVEVYKKLEHLCKLLRKHGFEYEIRKDPRSQGGGFKYFQTYQWAKVYPPGFIEHCRGKFSYIVGVSSDVHFHMMGIGNYQNEPASLNASEMSSRQTPHQNSSYEAMVQDFLKFDKSNRDLFIKTGVALGIEYCQHIMEENNLNDNVRILEFKNQIILQGPPGTGKTRLAKELINNFITVPDSISNELIVKYLNLNQIIESPGK